MFHLCILVTRLQEQLEVAKVPEDETICDCYDVIDDYFRMER